MRVKLVKESTPVAEKKPLIESAWATAALLTAKAANTTRRLSMVGLRDQIAAQGKSCTACRRCQRCQNRLADIFKLNQLFVPQFKDFPPHQTVVLYHVGVQMFAHSNATLPFEEMRIRITFKINVISVGGTRGLPTSDAG